MVQIAACEENKADKVLSVGRANNVRHHVRSLRSLPIGPLVCLFALAYRVVVWTSLTSIVLQSISISSAWSTDDTDMQRRQRRQHRDNEDNRTTNKH